MNTTPTAKGKDTTKSATLYMAIELGSLLWKLAFSDGGRRVRHGSVKSWDLAAVRAAVEAAKKRFDVREDARVASVYEAGRDGFEIHRALAAMGIENVVVDPSSIQIDRRARRSKTDRLDAERLLLQLMGFDRGERSLLRVLRVPSRDEEDRRREHRERERLKKERVSLSNRVTSLLVGVGIRRPRFQKLLVFLEGIEKLRLWDGAPLPAELLAEVGRAVARLVQLDEQLRDLDRTIAARAKKPTTDGERKIALVRRLKGIGPRGATVLVREFAWRDFKNRKQVAACAGLCGTPYDSGESRREQGISKAGNRRVRTLIVELAWLWVRYQGESALTKWFLRRFAGAARSKRVGIVALARKLLIALWRFWEHGVIPEGAQLAA